MAREQRLMETFVELADTLVDDYDVIDFLQLLAERCVELMEASEAGVMLADSLGNLRHAACSNERMRIVEVFELQLEQGPCFDAYRLNEPVLCATPEEAARRWPRFAPHARDAGLVSVAALPMRLRTTVIGALNVFCARPIALTEDDLRIAQALADIATIGILQERAISDARMVSSQLEAALQSRIVLEQAKGIVAEHNGINVDRAFALMRGYTRAHNRLLVQTARDIIAGTLAPSALEPTR
jgi:GAF domain-containing protein